MVNTKPNHSFGRCILATIGLATFLVTLTTTADIVRLPAGSVDALSEAIVSAGPGGTVILESGTHHESETVTVGFPITITGESGAILEGDTEPNLDDGAPDNIEPVLHILDTDHVLIEGLSIRPPEGDIGNTGILIQNAPWSTVRNNTITDHEFGVVVQGGDHARIVRNHISDMVLFGVVLMNGEGSQVIGNEVENVGIHGMWLCDVHGNCSFNVFSNCGVLGLLLCRFPAKFLTLPDGTQEGAASTATGWHVGRNEAHHNSVGYVVADGANGNTLANNAAWNNEDADIILDGEYQDPFEPACFENVVAAGFQKDLVILDFGFDNIISGDVTVGP